MDSKNPIIKLNIGGTVIQTYRSTIQLLEFFKVYLDRWLIDKSSSKHPESGQIFIDYDPALFIHLLNKLRDVKYRLPKTVEIKNMCEYFGYELDESFLHPNFVEYVPYTSKN